MRNLDRSNGEESAVLDAPFVGRAKRDVDRRRMLQKLGRLEWRGSYNGFIAAKCETLCQLATMVHRCAGLTSQRIWCY